jgi:hypothetical protein
MSEDLLEDVHRIIGEALDSIQSILASKNEELAALTPDFPFAFELIGGTVYFNNPDLYLVFDHMTRLMPEPDYSSTSQEISFASTEQSANKTQYRYLSAQCTYGECCAPGSRRSCKLVPSPSSPPPRRCGGNPKCP